MKTLFLALALISVSLISCAQDITLPAAQRSGGMPLMEALNNRKSTRQFDSSRPLSQQQLADLLWAACGYNREDKLTIPTALNRQEVTIYAIMPDGAYRYDARNNVLVQVTDQDIRPMAGKQPFAVEALLNIAIVSDKAKMDHDIFAGVAVGAVVQNIYLWCASNGIGTVTRGGFDGESLAKALNLGETERVMMVQTVGY